MPRKSIAQRIALTGAEEIQRALEELGKKGREAFESIKTAADNVSGAGKELTDLGETGSEALEKINAASETTTRASEGLNVAFLNNVNRLREIRDEAAGFGDALQDLGKAAFETGKRFAILLGGAGALSIALIKLTTDFARSATEASRNAQETGLTVEEWQRLAFAADQNGVSVNEFRLALSRLNTELQKVITEGSSADSVFGRLGINIRNTDGTAKSAGDVLVDLAEHFAELPDGVEKSALAVELFGQQAGPRLIPFLNRGRAGIQELGAEAERLGIVLTGAQSKIGTDLTAALSKATSTFLGLRAAIGETFAPDVIAGANFLTDLMVEFREEILFLANVIRTVLVESIRAIGLVVIPIFQGWIVILDLVADGLNALFGTELNGRILLLSAAMLKFLSVFRLFISLLPVANTLLRLLIATFGGWPVILASIAIAIVGLVIQNFDAIQQMIAPWIEFFQNIIENSAAAWEQFIAGVTSVVAFFVSIWDGGITAVQSFFQRLQDWAKQKIDAIIAFLKPAIELAKTLAALIGGSSSAAGARDGGAVQAAGGGQIRGPGTSRSDSIPAWLSDGEYVVRARAVKKYGKDFLDAINGMRFKGSGFALGGLVDGAARFNDAFAFAPAYANGGAVQQQPKNAGRPFNLHIAGEVFENLMASEEVAEKLVRFSTRSKLRSAGRKPNWHGG